MACLTRQQTCSRTWQQPYPRSWQPSCPQAPGEGRVWRRITFTGLQWIGAALVATLTACGPALNNDRFEEDARFAAALPASQPLELDYPATISTARTAESDCDPDALRTLTGETAESVNDMMLDILTILDRVRSQAPSERSDLFRSWGPFQVQNEPATWLRLEMVWDDPDFRYYLTLGDSEYIQPDVVMTGSFKPGSTASNGEGAFTFDLSVRAAYFPDARLLGALSAVYTIDGEALDLVVEGRRLGYSEDGSRVNESYAYSSPGDGSGKFYFDRPLDLSNNNEGARVTVWSGWDAQQKGRSDASSYLSSVDSPYSTAAECWDAAQTVTYFNAACDQQGDEAACSSDVIGWNE